MRQTASTVAKLAAVAFVGAGAMASFTMSAYAQKTTEQGIQEYRDMLADGKYYFAKKEVKVTLGGCGG